MEHPHIYCKDISWVLLSYQRKQLVTEDSCSVISSRSLQRNPHGRRKTQSNHLFFKYIHAACNFSAREIAGNTTLCREWKTCTAFELRGYKSLIAGESHCTERSSLHKHSIPLNAGYSPGRWQDMISHVLLCKQILKTKSWFMLVWCFWGL